ncbi:MAG: hypothetical protein QM680_10440 [Luteolibacter sp.]
MKLSDIAIFVESSCARMAHCTPERAFWHTILPMLEKGFLIFNELMIGGVGHEVCWKGGETQLGNLETAFLASLHGRHIEIISQKKE